MKTTENQMKCPNCDHEIDINSILYQQMSEKVNEAYRIKLNSLTEQEVKLQETVASQVLFKVNEEKVKLREQVEKEKSLEIESYKVQLDAKVEETRDFYKTKVELEQARREMSQLQNKITLESEQKYTQLLTAETHKLKIEMEEKLEFRVKEKEFLIERLQGSLVEAQRQAAEHSSRIQGEVQEIAIEDYLKASFPSDVITEVKKGVRGADCIQTINTASKMGCAKIMYESKRTKEFSTGWIETAKNNLRAAGANFAVIVTSAMPKDMDRFGMVNGVYICNYHEFKALCYVLRESAIMIDSAYSTQENKGDKMVMLYDFLTSSEFRLHIEAIVDGFTTMSSDLDKEKRAMEGLWKKREKMIEKVILNTNHLYSSIRGIAGNAVAPIQALELNAGLPLAKND